MNDLFKKQIKVLNFCYNRENIDTLSNVQFRSIKSQSVISIIRPVSLIYTLQYTVFK